MGSWEPDDATTVEGRPGYLWIVPGNVGGSWTLSTTEARGTGDTRIHFSQAFQAITGTTKLGVMDGRMRAARLAGDRVAFEMMDERGVLRSYLGRVAGDRIEGTTQAADGTPGSFTASRIGPPVPVDAGRD
jgi:hypothetical protein